MTLNMRQSCLGTVTAPKSLGVGLVPGSMSFSYFESANIVAVTAGAGLERSGFSTLSNFVAAQMKILNYSGKKLHVI